MSLQAPNLDDRRFQDIVDETKLLIPKYCPEWTNHNLSDPGVALIELFAWMSETLLYRLNQVPDRFYTKFLELMGIAPFPPTAAQADLTFWLSTVLDEPVTVRAGTQVGAPGAGSPVVFETVEDLVIAPAEADRGQDRAGRSGDRSARRCLGGPAVPRRLHALFHLRASSFARRRLLPRVCRQPRRKCVAFQGHHHQSRRHRDPPPDPSAHGRGVVR